MFSSWVRGPTCRWVIRFRWVALAWSTITARRAFRHPGRLIVGVRRLIRRCVPDRLQVATEGKYIRLAEVGCSFPAHLCSRDRIQYGARGGRAAACADESDDVECCAWGSCRGYYKSSPPLGKRKSYSLLPPPPRNDTRSTLEWSTQPTQSENHRSHWIATSKRALEGVCTSCTNQEHYSLVRMCTPCSKPHPLLNWRSRSRAVVTSYNVLIGSGTGAVHTHGPHIRMSVFHVHLCATSPSCLSLIPL